MVVEVGCTCGGSTAGHLLGCPLYSYVTFVCGGCGRSDGAHNANCMYAAGWGAVTPTGLPPALNTGSITIEPIQPAPGARLEVNGKAMRLTANIPVRPEDAAKAAEILRLLTELGAK